MGLPQHWLQPEVREGMARLAGTARKRGISLAIHTHVNAAQQNAMNAGIAQLQAQGLDAPHAAAALPAMICRRIATSRATFSR